MGNQLPAGVDVVVAVQTLGSTIRHTPLDVSLHFSGIHSQGILLKHEDIQVGRSYKARGTYNFISSLGAEEREAGVVCASAGNHTQGIAFACRQLKVHAKVFLPSTTPRQKRARIADIGGRRIEQVIVGTIFDEASVVAQEYAREHGAICVRPFDDPRTITGQGTVVKGVFGQASAPPAAVVVPVGDDGLPAEAAIWLHMFHSEVKVVGIKPEGAPSMRVVLGAGHPVILPRIDGFTDDTAVTRARDITFEVTHQFVNEVVAVPEGALYTEILELYQVEGVIAEPSGALAGAAVTRFLPDLPDDPAAYVVSGGNNDVSHYADIMGRSSVYEGLRRYFLVTFPQKPGALRHFLDNILADGEDIVFFEFTKENNCETAPALAGIEIQESERIGELLTRMEESPLGIEKLEPDSPVFSLLL